jgi:hypothetical protein
MVVNTIIILLPEVQTHLMNIVDEVQNMISMHSFDDYFYPYRITGENFNDTASTKIRKRLKT